MSTVDLVVFDFDGTLAETRVAVSTTVNAALREHGLPRVDPGVVHGFMGLPLERLFDKMLPPPRRPYDLGSLVAWYRARFDELGAPHVTPLAGAVEIVRWVRASGRKVAIATSRERSSLDPLLDRFDLVDAFDVIGTCDCVDVGKPDPALMHWVLDQAGVDAGRAVMVGDTTYDVEMANAAGVRVFGVPHGSHRAARLVDAGATLLDDLEGLQALL